MSLDESLTRLDSTLIERMSSVNPSLLEGDYAGIPGSSVASGPLYYRFLATAWVGPWGSVVPWLLPPSSTIDVGMAERRIILRLPQSRVRHFLCDASLFIRLNEHDWVSHIVPKITSATLRLGPDRVIQNIDSEFACRVALHYKRGGGQHVIVDAKEKSVTLDSPLFFEMPLKVLPLFVPNTPLPEIEYQISIPPGISYDSIQFFTEMVTSPGEADILPASQHQTTTTASGEPSSSIVQHLPSFTTFSSTSLKPTETEILIPISTPEGKTARAIYIRVFSGDCEDIPDAIALVDIIGPPPRSKSLLGESPLPGSICRNKLKTRFLPPPTSTKMSLGVDPLKLPYYVLPFAATPGGNVADYGVVLPQGSTLKLTLHPDSGVTGVEACVETTERVEWKR